MAELLRSPAGLAVLALGALALAAVALALAWSEWRRERNVSFLCASAAFGVVTLGELVAIADGLMFLSGAAMPPELNPLRLGIDAVAAVTLSFGLVFGVVQRRRLLSAGFILGILVVAVVTAVPQVQHLRAPGAVLRFDTHWSHTALQVIVVCCFGGGAVLLWRSHLSSRPPYSAGMGLLALCAALGGHLTPLPRLDLPPGELVIAQGILPVTGLALLVYGIYASIVAELQSRAAERIALLRELAETQGATVAGSIAAGVAHDMNGPLTAIASNVHLALGAQSDDQREERIRRIGDQVWDLAHLVNSLLDFARPAPDTLVAVDLRELLDDVLTLLAYEVRHGRRELVLQAPERLPKLVSRPPRLVQAVVNLVRHALRAANERSTITIRARGEPEAAVIEIEHQGAPLGDEELERMARPAWEQPGGDLQEQLALAASREVIERHGGSLSFRPTAAGNVAVVWLPLRQDEGD